MTNTRLGYSMGLFHTLALTLWVIVFKKIWYFINIPKISKIKIQNVATGWESAAQFQARIYAYDFCIWMGRSSILFQFRAK